MAWTVNGASTHARQLVAVFQVLCSLYGLTCVGYVQNSLEFVSRSPLIHVVGHSFCLYTDSLFAQIGDSNDKFSSSLEANVETKTKRTLYSSRRLTFNELTNAKNLVLHSRHFTVNWRCGIWNFRTSSFKCYVDHSRNMYSSGNIDVRNWVNLFDSRCTLKITLLNACLTRIQDMEKGKEKMEQTHRWMKVWAIFY